MLTNITLQEALQDFDYTKKRSNSEYEPRIIVFKHNKYQSAPNLSPANNLPTARTSVG
jgi:hypothetical protein